ncbi:hypothetical protein FPQ18DRAFT_49705 [Pyronema domesticum]|nr:hypothetical protein FPQ18DRAFT_49705 [Pyronema domesticum]
MPSPSLQNSWKYLGFALVAPTVIMALPTATSTNDQLTNNEINEISKRFLPGTIGDAPPPPPTGAPKPPSPKNDDDSDGGPDSDQEDDSDDEDDYSSSSGKPSSTEPSSSSRPSSTVSGTSTATPATSLQVTGAPKVTAVADSEATPVPQQSGADEAREHWTIAVGSVVAFVFICLAAYGLWRWRSKILALFHRRYSRDPEKAMKIPKPPKSRTRSLFGAATTTTGEVPAYEAPYPPPPALAPSTIGALDMEERRDLVRHTLLGEQRKPIARVIGGNGKTFLYDASKNSPPVLPPLAAVSSLNSRSSTSPPPATRKTKRESLSLALDPFGNAKFISTNDRPDSPELAKEAERYSWITPQERASTVRASMESAPRFRTVNSWVSQQANRAARQTEVGTMPPPPPDTPVEFRAHPGEVAGFVSEARRIESRVLDARMQQEQARVGMMDA